MLAGIISIHLMLMLIQVAGNPAMSGADFNTSHVNVNLNSWDKKVCHKDNFNTSHVNVNRVERQRYIALR